MFNYPYVKNFAFYIRTTLGIETKPLSYAVKEEYAQGRNKSINGNFKNCKHGLHTTWDNNEVFLRSSYEFEYAEILGKQKIHYEVESLRIKYFDTLDNCVRIAIPDFYIPSTNTIVEIKSEYTTNSINMRDKFKAYKEHGYNAKLILEHKEVDIENIKDSERYKNERYRNGRCYLKEHWIWMNKDGKQRKCNSDEIEELLLNGWNLGRNPNNQITDVKEYIEKRPEPEKRYIHKGDDVLLVLRKDIPKYLKDGWKTGRSDSKRLNRNELGVYSDEYTANLPNCQKRYIHKGSEIKHVSRYDVKRYIELGWECGLPK